MKINHHMIMKAFSKIAFALMPIDEHIYFDKTKEWLFDKIYPNENNVTFELRKESILLNARVNKIKNLLENRLISISDENIEYNRMNSSIISIIHRLSENDKLSDYINEISAHVELKTTLEFDNNTNKISDIIEDYIHIMGFDHLEMINKIATAQNYKVEYTKIRYPFLRQINTENSEKYKREICQISYFRTDIFHTSNYCFITLYYPLYNKASTLLSKLITRTNCRDYRIRSITGNLFHFRPVDLFY